MPPGIGLDWREKVLRVIDVSTKNQTCLHPITIFLPFSRCHPLPLVLSALTSLPRPPLSFSTHLLCPQSLLRALPKYNPLTPSTVYGHGERSKEGNIYLPILRTSPLLPTLSLYPNISSIPPLLLLLFFLLHFFFLLLLFFLFLLLLLEFCTPLGECLYFRRGKACWKRRCEGGQDGQEPVVGLL